MGGVFLNRKKNYQFKYHEYMIEHILKSQYILNNEKREKDIFRLILKGKNCKQIADIVGYGYGFNNGFYGNGFYGNTIV